MFEYFIKIDTLVQKILAYTPKSKQESVEVRLEKLKKINEELSKQKLITR